MREDIKNFVIEYNKRMSWNKDILKSIGKKNIPQYIIDEYLLTNILDEDKYDLENASLYEYGPEDTWAGTLELQAFSNERLCTTYFWVKSNESEEEYKAKKIESIKEKMNKKLDELYEKIKELTSEFKEYNKLKKIISNIK